MRALAKAWVSHFHAIRPKNGGRKVLDFFAAFARLSVACSELSFKPDFDAMNDAELREARDQLLAEYLNENLPTILETLINLGWTIIAPTNAEVAPDESNEASTTTRSRI